LDLQLFFFEFIFESIMIMKRLESRKIGNGLPGEGLGIVWSEIHTYTLNRRSDGILRLRHNIMLLEIFEGRFYAAK
jgi:uncharacterized protein (TIGR00297 family)